MTFEEVKQRIDDLLGIAGTMTEDGEKIAYRSPTGILLLKISLAAYEGSPSGWVSSFGQPIPEIDDGLRQILGM